MFLKFTKIFSSDSAAQCRDPTLDISLRNAVMGKGIFMCHTDNHSVLCQNHHYPLSKIDAFRADGML